MISSPRVLAFEQLVVDWALRLLDRVSQNELFKRSSLEEDQAEMESVGPSNWELYTLLKLNVVTKKVYFSHVKTLRILQVTLEKLSVLAVGDEVGYARVTHERVETLEDTDSDLELFRRRMGMRSYLKQLKQNLTRVHASKQAKEASRLKKAQ